MYMPDLIIKRYAPAQSRERDLHFYMIRSGALIWALESRKRIIIGQWREALC